MKELFNLKPVEIAGHQIRAVDARELHAFLEVGRDFSTWIKDRIGWAGFVEGRDYVVFTGIGENPQGGRPSKEYGLTINTAKELSMVENNEQGKLARLYFIECEERLAVVAPEQHQIAGDHWLANRSETKDYFLELCDAVKDGCARLNKEAKAIHYSNEADMINRLLLGTTAKKWLLSKGLSGKLRDHLTLNQLKYLSYLERTDITFIELGFDFQQRKEKLTELFARHMVEKTA